MEQRTFLGMIAGGLLAAPLAARAQPAGKIHRVGFRALQEGLRELGYTEDQNIVIESRWAEGKYARLSGLATELVRLKVDVIVTYAPPAIQAAKQATATIPIVMAGVIDPVATGLVTSLARPGGNVTGLSLMAPELVGKQLEIVKEVVPMVSRVALLGNPANAGNAPQVRYAQDAARTLEVRLQTVDARGPGDIERAFAAMTRERAGAVIVLVDAMLVDYRTRIADLAAKHRLPSVYGLPDHAEAGGLLVYGGRDRDRFRRVATYVDKILKGAKPGGLPIEQPAKFELVIDLKTAKALGLTIPPSLLQRADEVIE